MWQTEGASFFNKDLDSSDDDGSPQNANRPVYQSAHVPLKAGYLDRISRLSPEAKMNVVYNILIERRRNLKLNFTQQVAHPQSTVCGPVYPRSQDYPKSSKRHLTLDSQTCHRPKWPSFQPPASRLNFLFFSVWQPLPFRYISTLRRPAPPRAARSHMTDLRGTGWLPVCRQRR